MSLINYNLSLDKEVVNVLGSRSEITYGDLNQLEYTGLVFKETMRLWPPAGQVHRTLTKSISVNDMIIPKGATVSVSIYSKLYRIISTVNPCNRMY